jgi:hypothetical protein
MFSLFIVGFIVRFFVESWKNKSNCFDYCVRCFFLFLFIFAFFLAPMGVTVFFNHAGNDGTCEISARIIYAIGIALSLIIRDGLIFFKEISVFRTLSKAFSVLLIVWSFFFPNWMANLLKCNDTIQNDITRDIANDLYSIRKTNDISKIKMIHYFFLSTACFNATREYPFLKRILDLKWDKPLFSGALLRYNGKFYPIIRRGKIEDIKGATKIADRMWYDLYLSGNNTLIIQIKEPSN